MPRNVRDKCIKHHYKILADECQLMF